MVSRNAVIASVTPPGGNQNAPGSMVDGWKPDLRKDEDRMQAVLMVRI